MLKDDLFYLNIEGIQKLNDMIMIKIAQKQDENIPTIIFFPGDVQLSFTEMELDHETKEFQHECYEETIETLSKKYQGSNIIVIRPTRRDMVTISEFDNFYIAGMSILHLKKLLNNLQSKLEKSKFYNLTFRF